jgi:uncharacterized RDD family membrane protein YckC
MSERSEPFQDPEPGSQPPDPTQPAQPPPQGYAGYGYQQQGYGYSYGPVSNYSGFWRRAGAFLLDEIIIGVIGSLLVALSGDNGAIGLINLVLGIAYFSIFEGTSGQTVGGRVASVRVVDANTGALIGIPRAIGRNIARILSGLVFGLGYFWMLWDPRKQTWHDKIAKTVVVRTT